MFQLNTDPVQQYNRATLYELIITTRYFGQCVEILYEVQETLCVVIVEWSKILKIRVFLRMAVICRYTYVWEKSKCSTRTVVLAIDNVHKI